MADRRHARGDRWLQVIEVQGHGSSWEAEGTRLREPEISPVCAALR
jgi:hypothetical protein